MTSLRHRRNHRVPFEQAAATTKLFSAYTAAGKRPNRRRQTPRINIMNSSTTDKVKGTAKEVAGKVKEETGKAIGNPDLRDRGTAEKVAGKVERKVGEVKKVFGR
jgi:uncharacterized protein YjbJ (UPF0337 family)